MNRTTPITIGLSAAALVIAGAAAGIYATRPAGPGPAPAPASETVGAAPSPTEDPYAVYLKLAPKGAPRLSREDAQARAVLGCGQSWAPGTVDAALATAYAELCKDR